MDLSNYIGQIASLKEFLTLMSLTSDVGALTSFSWSLLLLASVQILRPSEIRFLAIHQSHPWMMCLLASYVSPPLRLCHLIALQILLCYFLKLTLGEDAVITRVEDNVLTAPITISLTTLVIIVITHMDSPPPPTPLPTWPSVFIWLFMWTTSSLQVVIRMVFIN